MAKAIKKEEVVVGNRTFPVNTIKLGEKQDKQTINEYIQKLEKENEELKNRNMMLERMMLTAGVEVDEKFGDNRDHLVFPTKEQLMGYKDLGQAKPVEAWRPEFNAITGRPDETNETNEEDDEDF